MDATLDSTAKPLINALLTEATRIVQLDLLSSCERMESRGEMDWSMAQRSCVITGSAVTIYLGIGLSFGG